MPNSGVEAPASLARGDQAPMLPASEAAHLIVDAVEEDRYACSSAPTHAPWTGSSGLNPERAARFVQKKMAGLLER